MGREGSLSGGGHGGGGHGGVGHGTGGVAMRRRPVDVQRKLPLIRSQKELDLDDESKVEAVQVCPLRYNSSQPVRLT